MKKILLLPVVALFASCASSGHLEPEDRQLIRGIARETAQVILNKNSDQLVNLSSK